MRIAIGSDHAGFDLKIQLKEYLESKGYQVVDYGTYSHDSCDYPDFAEKVCVALQNKEADYGILVCYTGIGMSMAANKFKGIRAALVFNTESATLTRQHNDANVLCLAAKDITLFYAQTFADIFLTTPFLGGRHLRRVDKVKNFEEK
jgi:ribose 5-phosphate isomerase B